MRLKYIAGICANGQNANTVHVSKQTLPGDAWKRISDPTVEAGYQAGGGDAGQEKCLYALSKDHILVGFRNSEVHRYYNGKWTSECLDPTRQIGILAFWGSSDDDIWAGGMTELPSEDAKILAHWDGTNWTWTTLPGITGGAIYAIHGLAWNNVWAAGFARQPDGSTLATIWHFDGTTWTATIPPPSSSYWGYQDISVVSSSSIWAIANYDIAHWNGSSWTTWPGWSNTQVRAFSDSDVWVSGQLTSYPSSYAAAFHWDGSSWTAHGMSPATYSGRTFLACVSTSDVWLTSWYANSAWHWNGSSWTRHAIVQSVMAAATPDGGVYSLANSIADSSYYSPYPTKDLLSFEYGHWRLHPSQRLNHLIFTNGFAFNVDNDAIATAKRESGCLWRKDNHGWYVDAPDNCYSLYTVSALDHDHIIVAGWLDYGSYPYYRTSIWMWNPTYSRWDRVFDESPFSNDPAIKVWYESPTSLWLLTPRRLYHGAFSGSWVWSVIVDQSSFPGLPWFADFIVIGTDVFVCGSTGSYGDGFGYVWHTPNWSTTPLTEEDSQAGATYSCFAGQAVEGLWVFTQFNYGGDQSLRHARRRLTGTWVDQFDAPNNVIKTVVRTSNDMLALSWHGRLDKWNGSVWSIIDYLETDIAGTIYGLGSNMAGLVTDGTDYMVLGAKTLSRVVRGSPVSVEEPYAHLGIEDYAAAELSVDQSNGDIYIPTLHPGLILKYNEDDGWSRIRAPIDPVRTSWGTNPSAVWAKDGVLIVGDSQNHIHVLKDGTWTHPIYGWEGRDTSFERIIGDSFNDLYLVNNNTIFKGGLAQGFDEGWFGSISSRGLYPFMTSRNGESLWGGSNAGEPSVIFNYKNGILKTILDPSHGGGEGGPTYEWGNIGSIAALGSKVMFVGSNGTFRSTNGMRSWSALPIPAGVAFITAVYVDREGTFYCEARIANWSVGYLASEGCQVFSTTDMGNTWEACGTSPGLGRITSFDAYYEDNVPLPDDPACRFGASQYGVPSMYGYCELLGPIPDHVSNIKISNIFVVAKNVILITFSDVVSANDALFTSSNYTVTNLSGGNNGAVKKVLPTYDTVTDRVFFQVEELVNGQTYRFDLLDRRIQSEYGLAVRATSKDWLMHHTKVDSTMEVLADLYNKKIGTSLRAIVEAIMINDEKIGGDF